jgi:uncharacterized membrane protein
MRQEGNKMTTMQVYMFTRLDHLIGLLQFWGSTLIAVSIMLVVALVGYWRMHQDTKSYRGGDADAKAEEQYVSITKAGKKVARRMFCTGVFLCVSCALIPTKQEAAVIYLLPKICNSEIAQELPGDLKSLYDMAKEYLKGLAPEKK